MSNCRPNYNIINRCVSYYNYCNCCNCSPCCCCDDGTPPPVTPTLSTPPVTPTLSTPPVTPTLSTPPVTPSANVCSPKFATYASVEPLLGPTPSYEAWGILPMNNYGWLDYQWLDYIRTLIIARYPNLMNILINEDLLLVYNIYMRNCQEDGFGRLPDYGGFEYWLVQLKTNPEIKPWNIHLWMIDAQKVAYNNSGFPGSSSKGRGYTFLTLTNTTCTTAIADVPPNPPTPSIMPTIPKQIYPPANKIACKPKFMVPNSLNMTNLSYKAYGISSMNAYEWTDTPWLNYLRTIIIGRKPEIALSLTNTDLLVVYFTYIKSCQETGGVGRLPDYSGFEYWCIQMRTNPDFNYNTFPLYSDNAIKAQYTANGEPGQSYKTKGYIQFSLSESTCQTSVTIEYNN